MKVPMWIAAIAMIACTLSAQAETLSTAAKERCCLSKQGPEPKPYTGKWLDGTYSRADCVAMTYGFWDGDTPNEARKVCARQQRVPEDPVPPPPEKPHTKFFGEEKFTVTFEQKGTPESGTITEHVSQWGTKRVEIKDLTMKFAGVVQTTKHRVIYDGAQVVTIDLVTGSATRITNPLWDRIASALAESSSEGPEFGARWAKSMGAQPTGIVRTIAGQPCEEWSHAALGSTYCVHRAGIVLATETKMGPIAFTKRAVAITLGDGGPKDAYLYDETKVASQPSLDDIRKRMRNRP